MAKYIEFEGKTIDQALEIASQKLGTPVHDIKYDIVSHGSSGIFGLVGVKKAKIRVVAKKAMSRDLSLDKIKEDPIEQAHDLVKDAFKLEEPKSTKPFQAKKEKAEDEEDFSVADMDENLRLAVQAGELALRKIVDFITENTTIEIVVRKERIIYKVEGGNSGLLIGKRGQTLEAIQYLVEKIINKRNGQRVRVLVDVEGYLETRKNNLIKMASRMAEKAAKINKPVTIGQMNAYDRRIVHLHLKDNQGVRTQSVGEGYYRKLVIFPKKRRRGRNSQ